MQYKIEFLPTAARSLRRLGKDAQRRIDAAIQMLREHPRPPKAKRLKGKLNEYYRIRTGNYRIVYMIEDDRLVICVVMIGDRKNVCRQR